MSSMSITVVGEKLEGQQVTDTTTGLDLFGDDKTIVAVRVNGELRDLCRPLLDGRTRRAPRSEIEPVSNAEPDGLAILRHSAAHVAAQAVQAAHPDAKLGIGPPITDGFYYDFDVAEPFTPEDLKDLEKRMTRIIKERQRFVRREVVRRRGPRRARRRAVQARADRRQGLRPATTTGRAPRSVPAS